MKDTELEMTYGGVVPPLIAGAALAVAGYVAKDMYDNWGLFKETFIATWKKI